MMTLEKTCQLYIPKIDPVCLVQNSSHLLWLISMGGSIKNAGILDLHIPLISEVFEE